MKHTIESIDISHEGCVCDIELYIDKPGNWDIVDAVDCDFIAINPVTVAENLSEKEERLINKEINNLKWSDDCV